MYMPECQPSGKQTKYRFLKTYEGVGSGENDETVVGLPVLFDELGNIIPFWISASLRMHMIAR
jgi:hypothetical protein